MDKFAVGRRVRRIREADNMTREKYSERIGVSRGFLAEIENGTKGMSAETMLKICNESKISADYILLGKLVSDREYSPIVSKLSAIEPQYSEYLEAIIDSFLGAMAQAKKEQAKK